jgi:plastocyanin
MIAAVAAATLAVPAAAQADIVITTETLWRFGASSYEITAGDKVVFKNNDLLSPGPHNVTSVGNANGMALFASKTGGYNTQFPVDRAELMPAGSYPFLCTVHTFMRGTLVIKAKPTPPADTTAPKLEAQVRSASRGAVLKSGRLRVRLASDEPVSFAVTTSTEIKKNVFGLARRFAFKHEGGALVVQVPLTGEGKSLLRKHKRVAVLVTLRAKDAAGNLAVVRAKRTLK